MAEAPLATAIPSPDLTLKISLAGNPGVGKSSVARRFVSNTFDAAYVPTLGTRVSSRRFSVPDAARPGATLSVGASVWDIMGSHQFQDLLKEAFFLNAGGVLLVFDVSRPETFHDLPQWYEIVASVAGPVPAAILANKCDLTAERAVSAAEVDGMAREFRWPWFETSAKTGTNVEAAFESVAVERLRTLRAREAAANP